jgi:hypothetical protein
MASYQPELHTAESVVAYYDNFDAANYTVYVGHKVVPGNVRYPYTGNDKNEGREQLIAALNAILQNPENTNTYCIAIFTNKGKKIEELNSISFQLNKRQSLQSFQQMGAYQPNVINEINALRSEMAAIKMKQEMDDQEEEEEDEPEEENSILGFFKSPQVQNMLLSQLAAIFAPTQKVTHVAGFKNNQEMTNETESQLEIDNEERIYNAIERLKVVDTQLASDLELLCEMAENDKMQFNFLLKMLRK